LLSDNPGFARIELCQHFSRSLVVVSNVYGEQFVFVESIDVIAHIANGFDCIKIGSTFLEFVQVLQQ
jgi:hypothetical protein